MKKSADEVFSESHQTAIHMLECFVVGMLLQVVIAHLRSLKGFTRSKD